MASTQQLRRLWFQVHKWIGLLLAILVIPISLTGAALVWHDALDGALNPERRAEGRPALTPSEYGERARALAAPGEKLHSLTFPDGEGAVVAMLVRPPAPGGGRPVRTILHLAPDDGRLLDRSASNEGAVHVMHVLHGSLMIPGLGRQIVGWIGVAMLLSSLTGLWLWWPLKGGIRRGLRWNRQPTTSGRLHYQGGFWIAIPLAVLSFTGAWISFPAFFAQLSGDPPPPPMAERVRRMAVAPLVETRLDPDLAIALASSQAQGSLATVAWPTEKDSKWKLGYRGPDGMAEVGVDDEGGAVTPPGPPRPETTARLMRRIHDGTGMGWLWQFIIFLGGIVPAVLAVTGVLMWLDIRRRRAATEARLASAGKGALETV